MRDFADDSPDEALVKRAFYRSRSQPFDLNFKANPKGKGGGKRARSQTIHLIDAMAQIGTEYKTVGTQYQDAMSVTDQPIQIIRELESNPNTRRTTDHPSAMTQIGIASKESSTQVESSKDSSYSEGCFMTENMKGVVKRFDFETVESSIRKPRKDPRPPVVQVNTCTQLGLITHERSVSPIRAFRLFCPKCQNIELVEAQREYEQVLSGSQRCVPNTYGLIQSENHGNRFCKRVQCGFPCLTDRSNLYCQVDVLGPPIGNADVESRELISSPGIETTEGIFEVDQEGICEVETSPRKRYLVCKRIQTGSPKISDLTESFTQTAVVSVHPMRRNYIASSTQIGTITREHESSPIGFEEVPVPVPPKRRQARTQIRDKEALTTVEAQKVMDLGLEGASMQATHHENVYSD